MFYAHFILSKKGPLAKVWLAAHWEKKLTKAHVFETDLEKTVDNILSPKVKMSLRTSGHLLLGIVRIYSRKQKYLIQDLGEACAKIKMAFRPGVVDLPIVEGSNISKDSITLPEIFENFETAALEAGQDLFGGILNEIEEDRFQSRPEDITIRDDVTTNRLLTITDFQPLDNEFGGMLEDIELEVPRQASHSFQSHASDSSHLLPPADTNLMEVDKQFENRALEFGLDEGFGNGDLLLPLAPLEDPSIPQINDINFDTSVTSGVREEGQEEAMEVDSIAIIPPPDVRDEGFVLQPLHDQITEKRVKRKKRKRRLVIDKEKELQGDVIRAQLQDPSDTMRPLTFAGPERKALLWKEMGAVHKLYHTPALSGLSPSLSSLITNNQTLMSSSDKKEFNKAHEREELCEDEQLIPVETTAEQSLANETVNDNDIPPIVPSHEFDMIEEHNEPPQFPLMREEEEEEERVSRIIPELPDLEGDIETTANNTQVDFSDTPTPGESSEDKRWNKRTQQVIKILDKCFEQTDTIHFTDITRKCTRKQAAARLYSCLLLGKEGSIQLKQDKPYSPIIISKPSISANIH